MWPHMWITDTHTSYLVEQPIMLIQSVTFTSKGKIIFKEFKEKKKKSPPDREGMAARVPES